MGKYSDINRGPELNKAYAELNKWRNLTPAQKQAAYRKVAKPKASRVTTSRVEAYIVPYGPEKPTLFYIIRGIDETQSGAGANVATTARTLVGTRVNYVLPIAATDVVIPKPRGFQPAKLIAKARSGAVDDTHESRFTGRTYTYAPTENVSTPFGRITADPTFDQAVRSIKGADAYKTFVGTAGNTITFVPES